MSSIRQEWGDFFVIATKNKNDPLNKILKNKNQLISLSITQSDREELPPQNIVIIPSISSAPEIKGEFLSSAPMVNPSIVGKNFFYVTDNNKLKIGERISAYVHNLMIKKIIFLYQTPRWYGVMGNHGHISELNQMVILKDAHSKVCARLRMAPRMDGLSQKGKINVDDEIVTNGAQLLLSEEFKYQIKNENED